MLCDLVLRSLPPPFPPPLLQALAFPSAAKHAPGPLHMLFPSSLVCSLALFNPLPRCWPPYKPLLFTPLPMLLYSFTRCYHWHINSYLLSFSLFKHKLYQAEDPVCFLLGLQLLESQDRGKGKEQQCGRYQGEETDGNTRRLAC